jgi:hypothetical protein
MAVFQIPFVTPALPQSMQISLNGVTYTIKVRWCGPANCWTMDLSDASNNPIVQGIPLITGCDLLEQFAYLDLGFSLACQTANDTDAVPTFANLGQAGNLFVATAS